MRLSHQLERWTLFVILTVAGLMLARVLGDAGHLVLARIGVTAVGFAGVYLLTRGVQLFNQCVRTLEDRA